MADGHTEEGSYQVTLTLTGDMVKQLTQLVQLAKMMNGRDFDTETRPETLDVMAYRAFLEEILHILYEAVEGEESGSSD